MGAQAGRISPQSVRSTLVRVRGAAAQADRKLRDDLRLYEIADMAKVLGALLQAVHHINGLALGIELGRIKVAHRGQMAHVFEQILNFLVQRLPAVFGGVEKRQAFGRDAAHHIGKNGVGAFQDGPADAVIHIVIKKPEDGRRRYQDGNRDDQQDFSFRAGKRGSVGISLHVRSPRLRKEPLPGSEQIAI